MRLTKKRPMGDVEFGKKDDDHWRAKETSKISRFPAWRAPRRRRTIFVVIGIYLLYALFIRTPLNLLSTEKGCDPDLEKTRPEGARPVPAEADDAAVPDPDGPIHFPSLTKSLYNVEKLFGNRGNNNHVLFAAASLNGISELIPLACDMAYEKLNIVHFAIMGRHDIPMRTLLRVNAVGATACPVYWHDARPDNGQLSSEDRMEKSIRGGLSKLSKVIQPQVVITNNDKHDELFLLDGTTQVAASLGLAHITLPHAASSLSWISDLDADSLKAWGKFRVEILIQAPSQSSGSLVRLLKSLDAADYLGTAIGLTIELPPNVDPILLQRLENYNWPPGSQGRKVTLRRRIHPHSVTPEEAAARAAEAFYPQNPIWSHVLFLSPQTELSPSYFHYLQYTILKYKYSSETKSQSERLFGISLELPSSGPSDHSDFAPLSKSMREGGLVRTPLALWQAPHSNAVLYFGDKWAELHGFVSNRLSARGGEASQGSTIISRKYPAFMGYVLELMRARGYYILYPFFYARAGVSLATVHNELYQSPEEFTSREATKNQDEEADSDVSESLPAEQRLGSVELSLYDSWSISDLLRGYSLCFPSLSAMPILACNGTPESDISGV
ncbi:hypothetical protein FQN54_006247 [Arachnomyces sp. PD_36]|nr:hypothetical protein FQN54_006247 [Arachnomyces sp. PD_36]